MEFQELIESRRSVRKYDSSKTVSVDTLRQLISAAVEAPSWKNCQTSRYYCVTSEEKKAEFRTACLPGFNSTRSEGAQLIVTTFVKDTVGFDNEGKPNNEVGNGWGFYDLGLQNENLILKAKEVGLDTLIMGIRDGEKIREMLEIPESEIVVSVIAVGYGAESPKRPTRKSVEEIAKFI
jgi:nitroreductase